VPKTHKTTLPKLGTRLEVFFLAKNYMSLMHNGCRSMPPCPEREFAENGAVSMAEIAVTHLESGICR
jgi:hypothetical protein